MIIRKFDNRESGKFFAIWPRRTEDGWACLEWLHWRRIPGWGWGSGDTFAYSRFVPQAEYDAGERAVVYQTPPSTGYCRNYCSDGPTPCHYPLCKWLDANGTDRCGAGPA